MKRLLCMLLCAAILLGIPVSAESTSADQPMESHNIYEHDYLYGYWNTPVTSHLVPAGSGYLRLEYLPDSNQVIEERFTDQFEFQSRKEIPLELPIYGGIYYGSTHNFIVCGQNNEEEDNQKEVIRIIRYSKDWERQAVASIRDCNTIHPFEAGSVRFAEGNGYLFLRTSHEMYASEDGHNHQANMSVTVQISDMTVTESSHLVEFSDTGYCSHSFDQYVMIDGEDYVAADLGDAYPRAVVIFRCRDYFHRDENHTSESAEILPIFGETGENQTGLSMGGMEYSESGYLVAGNSIKQDGSADPGKGQRNIFVTYTPKDTLSPETTKINWLTSHPDSGDPTYVSNPFLVKISSTQFLLLWTEGSEYSQLHYTFLDGQGSPTGQIYQGNAALSDCQPVLDGRRVVWYVTDGKEPTFYRIDLDHPDQVETSHKHLFEDYEVTQEPTPDQTGILTGTCHSCGKTDTVTLPILSESDYTVSVVTQETCTEPGVHRYVWNEDKYGTISIEVDIPALGHDYETRTVPPACTEEGYTEYTCKRCGHQETRDSVPALDHDWEAKNTVEPSCTEGGYTEYVCSRCGEIKRDNLTDALGHDYEEHVVPATCTEDGYTVCTCRRCGHEETRDPVPALGHDWEITETVEPFCTEDGYTKYVCSRCGETSQGDHKDALGHAYSYHTYEPTCTEGGYTERICTRCGESKQYNFTEPTGHRFGDWESCDPDPDTGKPRKCRTCSECGLTEYQNAEDVHNHEFGPWEDCIRDNRRAQVRTCRICLEQEIRFCENPFFDIRPDDYFYEPVLWAVDHKVTSGVGPGYFGPNEVCTRGQIVTFLWKAAGAPEPESLVNPFRDVSQTDYYYRAVLWAVENEITSGVGPNQFGPEQSCTRGQAMTFLWKAAGAPRPTSGVNPFTDVYEQDYYYHAVLWAVENGVTSGVSADCFGPNVICTRAQIVTFLHHVFA